ncbi:Splicing factor U2AF 26 kDa subunit [Sarcoptes scabiei]|nr:Splicing factor U2AF 26 kDa subunit [Sarcoptes scabiei]
MADYLASIFGTEKDKVNCSFYFKIGACRHGERCSRIHNKPTFSQTILLQNLYQNPQNVTQTVEGRETTIQRVCTMSDEEAQEHFDDFFQDVFVELEDKYGEIEEMNVCDNLGDHLVGNVYVKFRREEDAERAVEDLNNRWFGGKAINAELSPVTDFREACCRQYEMGGFCNFMHIKPISRDLRRELYGRRRAAALERRNASFISGTYYKESRSRSVERRRSRDRDRRDRDRDGKRDRESKRKSKKRRSRSRSRSKDKDHHHHRSHHRSRKHSKERDEKHRKNRSSKDDRRHSGQENSNENKNDYDSQNDDALQNDHSNDDDDENDNYNDNKNNYGDGHDASIDIYEQYQLQQRNLFNNGDNNDEDQNDQNNAAGSEGLYGSID